MFLTKDYPNLFPDYASSLQAQKMLAKERANVIPAEDWKEIMVSFKTLSYVNFIFYIRQITRENLWKK